MMIFLEENFYMKTISDPEKMNRFHPDKWKLLMDHLFYADFLLKKHTPTWRVTYHPSSPSSPFVSEVSYPSFHPNHRSLSSEMKKISEDNLLFFPTVIKLIDQEEGEKPMYQLQVFPDCDTPIFKQSFPDKTSRFETYRKIKKTIEQHYTDKWSQIEEKAAILQDLIEKNHEHRS